MSKINSSVLVLILINHLFSKIIGYMHYPPSTAESLQLISLSYACYGRFEFSLNESSAKQLYLQCKRLRKAPASQGRAGYSIFVLHYNITLRLQSFSIARVGRYICQVLCISINKSSPPPTICQKSNNLVNLGAGYAKSL